MLSSRCFRQSWPSARTRGARAATRQRPLCRAAPNQVLYHAQHSASFAPIGEALADLAAGKFVVVLDDEDRENEGDLIINADRVTEQAMAFMVEHTSGVICVGMRAADLDRLQLPLMVDSRANNESMYTAFTVTVDLAHGTTTGISAADRAATLRALADPATAPADLKRPGHIFPLRARAGGVLVRPGHTEASVDLAVLSGSFPAGALCEIVDRRDGSMARTPQLLAFAQEHGLKCITIADLVRYRLRHEQLLQPAAAGPVEVATRHGPCTAHAFTSSADGGEHVALVFGSLGGSSTSSSSQQHSPPLVAVVRQQVFRDAVGSVGQAGAGGDLSLDAAMASVAAAGGGVVLYVASAAAGPTGMAASLAHLQLECSPAGQGQARAESQQQQRGWDAREAAPAAQMLRALGVSAVRLLPAQCAAGAASLAGALADMGVQVVDAGSGPLGASSTVAAAHSNGAVRV